MPTPEPKPKRETTWPSAVVSLGVLALIGWGLWLPFGHAECDCGPAVVIEQAP